MAIDKLSDDIGKKIVEALKMRSAENQESNSFSESQNVQQENSHPILDDIEINENLSEGANFEQNLSDNLQKVNYQNQFSADFNSPSKISIDEAFSKSISQNLGIENSVSDIEFPTNINILNSLIAKLPVGVSKQTGALIIKQTMEALGFSMASVLQEAQQVQDNLTASARECQKNIIDYRNQIKVMEQKALVYQRQAVAMNEVINLFSKINN